MSDNSLLIRPNLAQHSYSKEEFPGMVSTKDLQMHSCSIDGISTLENVIPLTKFLFTTKLQDYCADPFLDANETSFRDAFKCGTVVKNVEGTTQQICHQMLQQSDHPILVTWKSIVIYTRLGKHRHATIEIVNKWCLLSKIIHIFEAHRSGKTFLEMAQDRRVCNIVLYAMRHHMHNFSTGNTVGHPCAATVHKLAISKQTSLATVCNVILAALYETKNVVLFLTTVATEGETFEDKTKDQKSDSLLELRKTLGDISNQISELFSTMNAYAEFPEIEKIIDTLGT